MVCWLTVRALRRVSHQSYRLGNWQDHLSPHVFSVCILCPPLCRHSHHPRRSHLRWRQCAESTSADRPPLRPKAIEHFGQTCYPIWGELSHLPINSITKIKHKKIASCCELQSLQNCEKVFVCQSHCQRLQSFLYLCTALAKNVITTTSDRLIIYSNCLPSSVHEFCNARLQLMQVIWSSCCICLNVTDRWVCLLVLVKCQPRFVHWHY